MRLLLVVNVNSSDVSHDEMRHLSKLVKLYCQCNSALLWWESVTALFSVSALISPPDMIKLPSPHHL